jgi:formate-dependent nitrite reductase membrane component NrfD
MAARIGGAPEATATTALWVAVVGVVASAVLLVSDLGRPARFLNMLRVFKWRSPMSVGVWLITAFGAAATVALVLSFVAPGVTALSWVALVSAALLGALVATYTGVLLSATVVPAWNAHRGVLPLLFGAAALGAAAALLELLGHRLEALHLIGFLAAAVETAAWIWTEARPHGRRDRALRAGRSGMLVRAAAALSGPVSLALRTAGFRAIAGAAFLTGALLCRFGWLEAGRTSTEDPEAAL